MKYLAKTLVAIFTVSSSLPMLLFADTNVNQGENIPNGFDFPNGCQVNLFDGGSIGLGVDLTGGELNVFGGQIAPGATSIASGFTNTNNLVNISGGNVGPFFQFFNSRGIITGGTLETFGVFSGSEVSIEGGTVTGFPDVFSNGVVNIRGGQVNSIRALAGSTINIEGTNFTIDDIVISLMPGQIVTVGDRDVTLSATLSDGSHFEIFLRSFDPGFPSNPVALPSSTFNLIGLERSFIPGDVNGDGTVDLLDVDPFVDLVGSGEFNPAADLNGDGDVNLLDVSPFIDALTE